MSARTITIVALIIVFLMLLGCAEKPESVKRFVLPPGEAEVGKQVFLDRRCYDCHYIPDEQLPASEQPGQVSVVLGGKVTKVKTYGDLLTAIVNPSHELAPGYAELLIARDGQSRMTNYNDVMTVTELTNLVTYLQTKYKIVPPPAPKYPLYPHF